MAEIVVDRFDLAERVLRRSDLRQSHYDEGAILLDNVLINLHGDEHRTRKIAEQKVFRKDIFLHCQKKVFPATVAETLEPFIARGAVDLVELAYRVMLNVTAEFSGVDRPTRSIEETDALLRILRKAPTLNATTEDPVTVRGEIAEALREFDERFFTPSADWRRATLAQGDTADRASSGDILTVLLGNAALDVPHDVLMKEIAFMLLAGAFTSVHSLSHAMHDIFEWSQRAPEQAARVRADPLLHQRCAMETTRLHPASPIARRRALVETELPNGRPVSPNDIVVIDLMAANRDTARFGADADVYNPNREVARLADLPGMSFGFGMHACIGRNLAIGSEPRLDADPATWQLGTIAQIMDPLLAAGARPDPENPAYLERTNTRPNWGSYPVKLSA